MTAIPVPPVSRLEGTSEASEENLFPVAEIKKSLDFATPQVVRKRVSRLSQNYQDIASECMKVFLRLRPFTEEELKNGEDQRCMNLSEDRHILTHTAPKDSNMFKVGARGIGGIVRHYTFTKVFDSTIKQKEFFDETTQPLVHDFIEGENALIFTYGVTNAGKTYTIQGTEGNEGILPRSIELLFQSIGDRMLEDTKFRVKMAHNLCVTSEEERKSLQRIKAEVLQIADEILRKRKSEAQAPVGRVSESLDASKASDVTVNETISDTSIRPQSLDNTKDLTLDSSVQGPVKYAVFVSFIEIYKELIHDLLVPVGDGRKESRTVLRLADDRKGVPYVRGMREIQVNSQEEVMKILAFGRQNLHVAATKLNKDSSRSHCIFTITLVQVMDIPEPHGGRVSKISFCDLAGSERTNKTREEGDRLKEASKINTSLMNLGMCLNVLRNNQKKSDKQQHVVPFRESRLTRLFQNFLCGQGRACMIVNANMCASAFDETAHAMKFSAIAQEVQVIAKPMKKSRSTLFEEKFERMMEARKNPRATIAWERTPLKEEKEEENEEEEDESSEDEEEEQSDSDEEQSSRELDVAYWKNREKKFRDIIERMRQIITEERKKNKNLEMSVRNKVAEGFENHIVKIEERHKARIEQTIEIMEEEQSKRLEIMAQRKDVSMEELKERMEKKKWELDVKLTNAEKKQQETDELLRSKITELQTLAEKLTASETEANMTKMDMQKKDEEIAHLRRKVERNRRRSSALDENQVIEDLQKENEEGRSIIQSLMEEMEEYRGKVEEAEDEIERLKSTLESPRKKEEDGSTAKAVELENSLLELGRLRERLAETERVMEQAANEHESKFKSLHADLEKSHNVNTELQKEVDTLKHELASVQDKYSSVEDETSAAKTKYVELEKETESLRKRVSSLSEDVKQKEKDFSAAKSETDNLIENNSHLKKEHDEMKASMLATESSLSKVKNKITDLTGKLNSSEEVVAALKVELAQEKEKNVKFEAESEKLRSSLDEKESIVSSLSVKLKKLEEGKEAAEGEVKKLGKDLEKEKSDKERVEESLAKTKSLLEEAKASQLHHKDDTKQREDELQRLQLVCKESQKSTEELSKKLKSQQDSFASEKKLLEDRIKDMSAVSESLKNSQAEAEKLRGDVKDASALEVKVTQERDQLRSSLEELRRDHTRLESEYDKSVKKLNQEIQTLKSERDQQLKTAETLQRELTTIRKDREKLEAQYQQKEIKSKDETNTEVEKLRAAMAEMDKTQAQQQKVIEENESEKAELVKRKEELEKEMRDLHDTIAKTKEEDEKHSKRAADMQHKLPKEMEETQAQVKKENQKEKEDLKNEIKHLKEEVKKVEKSKETEMKNFRDNRDRIVTALQEQINNMKSSNETLKESLDEAMGNNVKLQSQNAQYMAENKKLKEKEDSGPRAMRKSVSTSAILAPKLVRIKDEPKSPEPESKKAEESSAESEKAVTETGKASDNAGEEQHATTEAPSPKRSSRRTKRGSSTSSRSSKRARRAAGRPATPLPEQTPSDEEKGPSPRKSRRTTAGRKKSSVKVETTEQGVLDDSELLRETGNSQMFPKSTMELDVTPQLKKTKTRKRAAKTKDEEHSSDVDEGVSRSKSTRRKPRANKNNNNASDPSEEDQAATPTQSSLTKVGGMIKNSPVGQAFKRIEAAITPTSKSPNKLVKEEVQVRQSRRGKKKLQADDISLPLEATPSPDDARHGRVIASGHLVSATPARMIRRLRDRK